MRKILLFNLIISLFLWAEVSPKKAIVTNKQGNTQEVFITDESLDSLKVDLLGKTISIPKEEIVTVRYLDSNYSAKYPLNLAKFPLQHKKYGLETSLLGLLTTFQGTGFHSSSFSIFNLDRTAEILIPLNLSWDDKEANKKDFSFITGVQYRKFLPLFDQVQDGVYVSALYSLAKVLATYNDSTYNQRGDLVVTEHEFSGIITGFGMGCGYRYFSPSGWYWGTGFSLSRYLQNNKIKDLEYSSPFGTAFFENVMFDFEILKFGYAF